MFIMNNVILCFVRNDGYPNLSMFAMIAGSLSNIVLDYVFMFPLNMGIFGAVLATGIAPIISLSVLSWIFLKKKNGFQIIRCKLSLSLSKYIISSGIPSLITEVSSGIVMIVFNFLIMQLAGNVGVAAYGVIANLSLVVISIYTGIAQGIQPLMSRNYGSGKEKEVHTILKYALLSVTIIYLCIYICIFFGADSIVNVFNNDQNPNLQKIAFIGLKVYFLGSIFAGYNIVLSTYYTSTENPRPAHIISLLRGVILVIPIAFLLSSTAGMLGVWCVFPLTEFLVSGVALRFYHLNKLVFA
ncbi:hypothetical protein LJC02_02400 [Breznakia sp. OttesenSCG-928-G09]|nr:hypothetical protein [Breznakia sp. OttesenSCG-928-G09]